MGVPVRPAASDPGYALHRSDPVESLGRLIGLRLAQTSVDSSEMSFQEPALLETNTSQMLPFSSDEHLQSVSEPGQATGLKSRRKVRFDPASQSGVDTLDSYDGRSLSSASSNRGARTGILKIREHPSSDLSPVSESSRVCRPYGEPFVVSDTYLKECTLSVLYDLLAALNYDRRACCPWHANISVLASFVNEMTYWRQCSDNWPPNDENRWQCLGCSAVISSAQSSEYCWLCNKEADGSGSSTQATS